MVVKHKLICTALRFMYMFIPTSSIHFHLTLKRTSHVHHIFPPIHMYVLVQICRRGFLELNMKSVNTLPLLYHLKCVFPSSKIHIFNLCVENVHIIWFPNHLAFVMKYFYMAANCLKLYLIKLFYCSYLIYASQFQNNKCF